MKTYKYISLGLLLSAGATLQSCLDFDTPVDDLKASEITIDDVVLKGKADEINYQRVPSAEGFDQAVTKLKDYLSIIKTAQLGMRGGKNGGYPVSHAYQRQYTLADVYAGYAVVPHHDFAFASELVSSYDVSQDWNGGPNGHYVGIVKNNFVPLLNHPDIDSIPEMKAITLLMLDYSSIENADIYGPFPFADYKANKEEPPFTYNDVKSIYESVKVNIDTIVKCLQHFEGKPTWYKTKVQDLLYENTFITRDKTNGVTGFDTWIRFANSLKLRMALHIVKVDAAKARKWAEEAVAGGVVESRQSEVALYPLDGGYNHPLVEITSTWGDERMNASLESILQSLNHPYKRIFAPNSDALSNGTEVTVPAKTKMVGIRSGLHVGQGQSYSSNQFIGFSQVRLQAIANAPLYLMKWAEVDFLRAEGALRGWNMGGTPEFFYNRGIENSYLFDPSETTLLNMIWTNNIEAYKEQTTATPYTYSDPTGSSPDIESVTKIGVKWDETEDREVKLEKIITQKYLALYPNSFEAWGEARRTGYPRMFPVLNPADGDGSLKDGDLVRRMLFPNTDDASLQDIQTTGLKALGGPDQQATRLWWDVEGDNF